MLEGAKIPSTDTILQTVAIVSMFESATGSPGTHSTRVTMELTHSHGVTLFLSTNHTLGLGIPEDWDRGGYGNI